MSWSELDIPNPEEEAYYDDCASGAPIHSFGGLKSLLTSLGYHVKTAEGYKAIDVADVTLEEIRSGAIEFTNDGIFVTTDGVRRKVFLYKRDYRLSQYGKPRAHIRKCDVIDRFSNGDSIPLYRRANTDSVWVHDMDDNMIDKQVTGLNICSHCVRIAQEAYPKMTVADFIELLQNSDEAIPESDVEVDIFGYTKDWELISRGIREEMNYTCEECGLSISDPFDQHFIHVHHLNGRKIDNRRSNLRCLCLRCHANVDEIHKERLLGTKSKRLLFSEFEKKYPSHNSNNESKPRINIFESLKNFAARSRQNPADDNDLPF